MRCAMPSTTAVLPTPASPTSTGLFLVRAARIWIVRRISSSRPITGSSLPCCASRVRSRRVALERLVLGLGILIGDALVAAHLDERLEDRVLGRAGAAQRVAGAAPCRAASASRKCSVEMYSSFIVVGLACAACSHMSLSAATDVDVERCAVSTRQLLERALEVRADDARIGAELRRGCAARRRPPARGARRAGARARPRRGACAIATSRAAASASCALTVSLSSFMTG